MWPLWSFSMTLHRVASSLLTSHPRTKCEEASLLPMGQLNCCTLSQKASQLRQSYRGSGLLGPTRCQHWEQRTPRGWDTRQKSRTVSSLQRPRALATTSQETINACWAGGLDLAYIGGKAMQAT